MNKAGERLWNGLVKENPTFVLMLGMCPTLAVTTSAVNGLGMGLTTLVVLALSNLMISAMRKIIPNSVRIPAFIVIIASFVTIVQLLLEAYLDSLNDALGVYIPLIVVNCIILGRAESYAYSNPPIPSLFDGIGMGLGFTVALTCIGGVRELLGAGELFGRRVMPESFTPIGIFVLAPGAFFVLAGLSALQNVAKTAGAKKGRDVSKIGSGCGEDCLNCGQKGCSRRLVEFGARAPEKAEAQTSEKTDARSLGKAEPKTFREADAGSSGKAGSQAVRETDVRNPGKANPKTFREADARSSGKAESQTVRGTDVQNPGKADSKTFGGTDVRSLGKADSDIPEKTDQSDVQEIPDIQILDWTSTAKEKKK